MTGSTGTPGSSADAAATEHPLRAGESLTLAREHFDPAEQYFWVDPDGSRVLTGPTIASLIEAAQIVPEPDDAAVHRYLLAGVSEGEQTMISGIRRVPAGREVVIGADDVASRPLGDLAARLSEAAAAAPRRVDSAVIEEFRELLVESAQRRIAEGETTGAALTGDAPLAAMTLEEISQLVREREEPPAAPDALAAHRAVAGAAPAAVVLADTGIEELLARRPEYAAVQDRQLRRDRRLVALAARSLRGAGRHERMADVPMQALLNSAFVAAHHDSAPQRPAADLGARRVQDLLEITVPAQLHTLERSGAHAGAAVHPVLLDERIVELLLSLDPAGLAEDGWYRLIRGALGGDAHAGAPIPPAERRRDWLVEHTGLLREVFTSPSFAARRYIDARSVLALMDDVTEHPERHDPLALFRLLALELWLREVIDPHAPGDAAAQDAPSQDQADDEDEADGDRVERPKPDHEPNPGKHLDLVSEADAHTWRRLPLQVPLVARGDDITQLVAARVEDFAASVPAGTVPEGTSWYFVISEKIIAITQGRSWFTWEIAPRRSARVLSRFVTRTPAGIGLGDPTTMELAIREVGLPRVLAASAAGAAGKVLGRRGLFYEVVGADVRAIDGPTPYSAFPSNVSAKLPPKDPDVVSAALSSAIRAADIPAALRDGFSGTVVMDANDIGRNVLGTDVAPSVASREELEATFADNPLGQGRQRTPMAVLVDLGENRDSTPR